MLKNDFTNKAVLITGGTKGIGLAIGLAFAKEGAQVYLTYKWGSGQHDALARVFTDAGALAPILVEADAAIEEDTQALLDVIKQRHDRLEVFVSNVSFAQVVKDMKHYKKRSFLKSLEYSAWPFMGYSKKIKEVFGQYPRYILATSSDGPDAYCIGYDFVAVSKAVMETFCKYMAKHLQDQDVRVNVLRARPVSTDSLRATFGEEFEPFVKKYHGEEFFITTEEVGDAALAMCSGLMDAMTGQVLMLDRGIAFRDNIMHLFEHREDLGLSSLS